MRIVVLINELDVIECILCHLGRWEPPGRAGFRYGFVTGFQLSSGRVSAIMRFETLFFSTEAKWSTGICGKQFLVD